MRNKYSENTKVKKSQIPLIWTEKTKSGKSKSIKDSVSTANISETTDIIYNKAIENILQYQSTNKENDMISILNDSFKVKPTRNALNYQGNSFITNNNTSFNILCKDEDRGNNVSGYNQLKNSIIEEESQIKNMDNIQNIDIQELNEMDLFFKNIDCLDYIDVFKVNKINFKDLVLLTKEDLIELNLPLGPRNRILKSIKSYNNFFQNSNNIEDQNLSNSPDVSKIKTEEEGYSNQELIIQTENTPFFRDQKNFEIKELNDNKNPKYSTLKENCYRIGDTYEKVDKIKNNDNEFIVNDEIKQQVQYDYHDENGSFTVKNKERSNSVDYQKFDNNPNKILIIKPNSSINKEVNLSISNISKDFNNSSMKINRSSFSQNNLKRNEKKIAQISQKSNKIKKEFFDLTSKIEKFQKNFRVMKQKSQINYNFVNKLLKKNYISSNNMNIDVPNEELISEFDDIEKTRDLHEELNKSSNKIKYNPIKTEYSSIRNERNEDKIEIVFKNKISESSNKKEDLSFDEEKIKKIQQKKNLIKTNLERCKSSIMEKQKMLEKLNNDSLAEEKITKLLNEKLSSNSFIMSSIQQEDGESSENSFFQNNLYMKKRLLKGKFGNYHQNKI